MPRLIRVFDNTAVHVANYCLNIIHFSSSSEKSRIFTAPVFKFNIVTLQGRGLFPIFSSKGVVDCQQDEQIISMLLYISTSGRCNSPVVIMSGAFLIKRGSSISFGI